MVLKRQTENGEVTHYGGWHIGEEGDLDGERRPITPNSSLPGKGRYIEKLSRYPNAIRDALEYELIPLEWSDGHVPCTFCNARDSVRERGVIYSDYKLIDPDQDYLLGYSCHACVDE